MRNESAGKKLIIKNRTTNTGNTLNSSQDRTFMRLWGKNCVFIGVQEEVVPCEKFQLFPITGKLNCWPILNPLYSDE